LNFLLENGSLVYSSCTGNLKSLIRDTQSFKSGTIIFEYKDIFDILLEDYYALLKYFFIPITDLNNSGANFNDLIIQRGNAVFIQNLFEQAVAFQRVNDVKTEPVSSLSGLASTTGPWTSASTIYSVSLVEGDTMSLYIQYKMGQVREYGIDPTVVAGLGPKFTSAPVYQLTFAGRTFNIPIGTRDTNPSGYANSYNMGQFTENEISLNNNGTQTIELRLIASPPNVKSVFDY
jgi:hypothetical protein